MNKGRELSNRKKRGEEEEKKKKEEGGATFSNLRQYLLTRKILGIKPLSLTHFFRLCPHLQMNELEGRARGMVRSE